MKEDKKFESDSDLAEPKILENKDGKVNGNAGRRETVFLVVCGKRRIGKTTETRNIINEYITESPGVPARKVLIVDVNNEFSEYKALNLSDVAAFSAHPKIEARRIQPFIYDPELRAHRKMTLDELAKALQHCLENFWTGMILIEDITKYISDNMPSDLIGSLCTMAHIDVDVICHFQGVGKAGHPKIKANMNMLRLHKCLDTVERHKMKFEEYTGILKIGETLVNARYDEGIKKCRELEKRGFTKGNKVYDGIYDENCRFFVLISFDDNKITGKFNKDEFKKAIETYISENPNETIKPLLNHRNREGGTIYNYAQAYDILENNLIEQYYGNPD